MLLIEVIGVGRHGGIANQSRQCCAGIIKKWHQKQVGQNGENQTKEIDINLLNSLNLKKVNSSRYPSIKILKKISH